jgi:hypothetical protein
MQKNKLIFSSKIEVRNSPIEGFGVFAKEDIQNGETLEESPFIVLPQQVLSLKPIIDTLKSQNLLHPKEKFIENLRKNLGFKDAEDYYFKWMPKYHPDGEEVVYTVLPLGFGPIYNTSNSGNNAEWKIKDKTFIFTASKDIKANEEIFTFYGYFLDEDGIKFECDDVFNFGLDYFDGAVAFKSVRFGNLTSYTKSQNDIFFTQIFKLLKQSKSHIYIKKVTGYSALKQQLAEINIPKTVSLKDLFGKLREAKSTNIPQIEFIFEYIDKNDGLIKNHAISWNR